MLNNKVYDVLKYITLVALPAIGALYGTLSKIWGLPYGVEIVSTISAITVCLGTLLGISSIKYNRREAEVIEDNSSEDLK